MASIEDKASSNRRKKLLIYPNVQVGIIGFNVVLAALAIGLLLIENIFVLSAFMGDEFRSLFEGSAAIAMIEEERQKIFWALLITSFVILVVMVVGGLVLSNRIVGPVYRLRKHLLDIAGGKDIKDLRFRKKDYFPEVADACNQAIRKVAKR